MKTAVVRVPATTANLGPGFDCFGCALSMYNTLRISEIESGLEFVGVKEDYCNEDNLAVQGYRAVAKHLGLPPRGLHVEIETGVPVCRGLGSSSTMIAGGALAANALHGSPLDTDAILEICTEMEGHPDNLAPALYGGLTASLMKGTRPISVHFVVSPRIRFTALIPDFEFETHVARAVLPKSVKYADAIFNISHGALMLKALETGNDELLREAMADRLHEPYRRPLIYGSDIAEAAARECGALGFALSGAGPTFLCLSTDPAFSTRIREKMQELLPKCTVQDLAVDLLGASVALEH